MSNEKDRQILNAIVKSSGIDIVGRGTLVLDPKIVVNSEKYKDLLEKTKETLTSKNAKAKK